MKKIFMHICLALSIGVFSSCSESFIDLEPTNVLASNLAFQSIDDVEAGLLGAYTTLRATHSRDYSFIPDILGDHTTLPVETLGNERFLHAWTYTSSDGDIDGLWQLQYLLIERANVVLEENEVFRVENPALADQIRGEALALRALAHFDLVRFFADNYSVTPDGSHLGVPIKLQSRVITTPARNTVAEVYAQVIADLTEAKTLLASGDSGSLNRFSEMAVTALLARVAQYQEDWDSAITYSSEVINNFSLASIAEFDDLWREDVGPEIIMKIPFNQGEAAIGGVFYNEVNDQLNWSPSDLLTGLYDQANDVRFNSFFRTRPVGSGLVDNKYSGREVGGVVPSPGLNDFKLFRVAEMYLIRAEAHALKASPDLTAGAADLNAIGSNRITGYVNASFANAQSLVDAVMLERQRELCFEGHRWFDLKRKDLNISRSADCSASPSLDCDLENSSPKWVLPIPQNEVFANGSIIQNPGYN